MSVWCAKHRDGWCAIKPNRRPPEETFQVKTKCEFFICMPWGFEQREPTCELCQNVGGWIIYPEPDR